CFPVVCLLLCPPLFPYTTLFRSRIPQQPSRLALPLGDRDAPDQDRGHALVALPLEERRRGGQFVRHRFDRGAHGVAVTVRAPHQDRKSTRLNSSHLVISYAVFCL